MPAATLTTRAAQAVDTQHEDMIHDAQLDYYGKRLATCSSDRTVRIFDAEGADSATAGAARPVQVLREHDGPVWQAAWAHPKFGSLLASCGYDGKVVVWQERAGSGFVKVKTHAVHSASVNSIDWAPHEYGRHLACASSDGTISVLSCDDQGAWTSETISQAHALGANAVSWAPAAIPGSLVHTSGGAQNALAPKRIVSGGCDNAVKVWVCGGGGDAAAAPDSGSKWRLEATLEKHTDWVRDVAWAPSVGLPVNMIASCSQDKTALIWTQDPSTAQWAARPLKPEPFPDVVWRASWSASGNILAVSGGDNRVTLWKESLDGSWNSVGDVTEQA